MIDVPSFMKNVRPQRDKCWLWVGRTAHGRDYDDYGILDFDQKPRRAHRVSYTLFVGPIPDGMVLDHLCRRKECVNPAHLEVVTMAENTYRGHVFHLYELAAARNEQQRFLERHMTR